MTTITETDLAEFAALPAGAPVPTPSGTISPVAVARIRDDEEAATRAGFSLPPPVFAAGTRVVDLGDENFATERRRVDALPLFAEAADGVAATVAAEGRRDMIVPLAEMRLRADGVLYREGREARGGARLEPRAFSSLCARAGFGRGAAYLRENCDPELRAFNVSAQLMALDADDGPQATMRLRRDVEGAGWATYAIVSPRYAAYDVDQFLRDATPALADARAEIVYDAERCRVRADAYWMPDHVVDLAAGDVFKAGVRLRTSDDGRGAVTVEAVLFRNLCLNLIVIGEAQIETVRERHVGDVDRIAARVRDGVEAARQKIDHFLGSWGHARTLRFDMAAEVDRLVSGAVRAGAPKSAGERLAKAFALAYSREPGGTVADAANAVTRAAHEGGFGQDTRDVLERFGAQVIAEAPAYATA